MRKGELLWLGQRTVKFHGLTIRTPMTYVVEDPGRVYSKEPSAINVADPIAPSVRWPPTGERELPYWPRYEALSSQQRRNYLEWLAGGRTQVPPELGYTFLFIYGLERRALVDNADHAVIFDEVLRLRDLYLAPADEPVSRSFDGYTSAFLWFLAAVSPEAITDEQVSRLARTVSVWTGDSLAAALSRFAETGTPLPAWAAQAAADALPQTQRSVVVRRVGEQFRDLFAAKYRARFGEAGLVPRASKRTYRLYYKTASAAIGSAQATIANPMGVPSQFKPLADIWNQCLADLKKFSSLVARADGAAEAITTVAAWEALPEELRADVDHPCAEPLRALVAECTREDGRAFVGATRLARTLGFEGDAQARLTVAQARRACQTAWHAGYAVEPDARLTGKGYRADEVVAVFPRPGEEEADPTRYAAAAGMLRVGMVVAAADGEVDPREVDVLTQEVTRAFDLSAIEHRRLEALRSLFEHCPPDWASVGRLSQSMTAVQRAATGRLLLALVAADGVITDDELRAVRKGYATLGLDKDEAESAIASLTGTQTGQADEVPEPDELATVVVATAAAPPGEPIPDSPPQKPRAAKPGLRLDRAAIAAIMSDTQEVARMLAEAMQAGADDAINAATGQAGPVVASAEPTHTNRDVLPATPTNLEPRTEPVKVDAAVVAAVAGPDVIATDDPTLPARYAAFCGLLLAKGRWELKEADALARGHGHMLAGAVEALNEWAAERYGGQLFVEDGDHLVVEQELLN